MTVRQSAYKERLRARGLCQKCRQPATVNPSTGLPFIYCRPCRFIHTARMLARYYARKAEAIA